MASVSCSCRRLVLSLVYLACTCYCVPFFVSPVKLILVISCVFLRLQPISSLLPLFLRSVVRFSLSSSLPRFLLRRSSLSSSGFPPCFCFFLAGFRINLTSVEFLACMSFSSLNIILYFPLVLEAAENVKRSETPTPEIEDSLHIFIRLSASLQDFYFGQFCF